MFDPSDEDEAGHWRFTRRVPETWPLGWGPVKFHGRFAAFRHLAVFPEQAANWALALGAPWRAPARTRGC